MALDLPFAFEGMGGKAGETDVFVATITQKGQLKYEVTWMGIADALQLG